MKREDILAIFPDATKEQIDAILNQAGAEVNLIKNQLQQAEDQRADQEARHASVLDQMKHEFEGKIETLNNQLQAGMSEEDRMKAAIEEADKRAAEFTLKSNTLDAREIFLQAGLGEDDYTDLLSQVVTTDSDQTKANAQAIVAVLNKQKKSVEEATRDAVLKSNPTLNGAAGENTLTKDQFSKMSYTEMLQAKQDNPELVASFMK